MGRGGTIKPFHDLILAWQPDLPPGLPAYVNPHIEHSQNVNLEIFYISVRRGRPSRFADYLAKQLACSREEAVCLLWDSVTPCAELPQDLCPTQNHLLLFSGSHLCSSISSCELFG